MGKIANVAAVATSIPDADLFDIADSYCGPTYVYDLAALRSRVDALRRAFARFPSRLFFATMANDNPVFLHQLAQLGVGACVNSPAHLNLALEAGIAKSDIQFTSTGLSARLLKQIGELGTTVNLDSAEQIASAARVGLREGGLRINAHSLDPARPFDRMGCDIRMLGEVLEHASACQLSIVGLHVYLGTNVLEFSKLVPALKTLFARAAEIEGLHYLNIGGGIGVDYRHSGPGFDVTGYGDALAELSTQLNNTVGRPVDVIIEPGRGMAAGSGRLLTQITDRKCLNGVHYLGVDASIAIFPRPFHHPDPPHRIRPLLTAEYQEHEEFVVTGCTTFSKDILGTAVLPDSIKIGDFLVIDDAGAYSQSMITRFLGQAAPDTVFLNSQSGTHLS